VAKGTQGKLNLKRDHQAQVYSGQMVLVVIRQEGWTMLAVAKDTEMKVGKTTLGSQGTD
jgi:hypothetical protein